MKKLLIALVVLTLVSCHKTNIQPANAEGTQQKAANTPRCWTIDFRWKELDNGIWYNFQELTPMCNLDSVQMSMKADTLRAINLPAYKVTYVAYWEKP